MIKKKSICYVLFFYSCLDLCGLWCRIDYTARKFGNVIDGTRAAASTNNFDICIQGRQEVSACFLIHFIHSVSLGMSISHLQNVNIITVIILKCLISSLFYNFLILRLYQPYLMLSAIYDFYLGQYFYDITMIFTL